MRRPRTAKSVFATVLLFTALAPAAGASGAADGRHRARSSSASSTATSPATSRAPAHCSRRVTPTSPSILCSGTLIGCQTFLTAGHCVADDLNPAHYTVFLQHAGFFSVTSIALHPDFDFPVGDVAVLSLGAAINGIRPTPINTTAAPAVGPVRYHRRVRPDRWLQSRLRHQARRQRHHSHVQERRVEYDLRLLELPRAAGNAGHELEHLQRRFRRPAVHRLRRRSACRRRHLGRRLGHLSPRGRQLRRQRVRLRVMDPGPGGHRPHQHHMWHPATGW